LGPGSQLEKSDDDVRFEAMADSVWKSLKLANNCLGAYQTLAAAHKGSHRLFSPILRSVFAKYDRL
jgi:hypothetical protein